MSGKDSDEARKDNEINEAESFLFLGPESVDISSYEKILDWSMIDQEVKNIGITGIYGSGKSSIWKSYCEKDTEITKEKKKHISIALGPIAEKKEGENDLKIKQRDSVERHLIKQLISQIPKDNIKLSKYLLKENTKKKTVLTQLGFIILAVIGIFILLFHSTNRECMAVIGEIFILLSLGYFLYNYVLGRDTKLNKFKISSAEAEFQDDKDFYTVFDRDIKELVYLFTSAKENIFVFEDLDRLDNKEIFIDLRNLNTIINNYLSNRGLPNKKFIYMLRSSIFDSKELGKFFDITIPVIPVITSFNSEHKILSYLKDNVGESEDKKFLQRISRYIDDMRMLKNIINEFKIYKNRKEIKALKLNLKIILGIVVLKNFLPEEFENLQINEGGLFEILNSRKNMLDNLNRNIDEEIKKLVHYKRNVYDEQSIDEYNEKIRVKIKEKYENEKKSFLDLIRLAHKEPIEIAFSSQLDRISRDKKCRNLIVFLINERILDENYGVFINNFYEDILSLNDINFLLAIKDNRLLPLDYKIENIDEVYSRLVPGDFINKRLIDKNFFECICKEDNQNSYANIEVLLSGIKDNDGDMNFLSMEFCKLKTSDFVKFGEKVCLIDANQLADILRRIRDLGLDKNNAENKDNKEKIISLLIDLVRDSSNSRINHQLKQIISIYK